MALSNAATNSHGSVINGKFVSVHRMVRVFTWSWVMVKWIILRHLIGSLPTPPTPKNLYKQPREQVLFLKTRKKHINGFFRKLCFHLFILINNIPMQNELTLAWWNFVVCRANIQWTNFFLFIFSTMSNTCGLLQVGVQLVSFND